MKLNTSMTISQTAAILLISAPLLILNGCKKADDTAEKPVITVQAAHPETGPISEVIDADAILSPVAQAALQAKITAPVKAFYVKRGSRVKAGQLVAVLENADIAAAAMDNQAAYEAAKGAYTSATVSTVPEEQTKSRLDVEQAKATLDLNNNIAEQRKQLLAKGAIPARDYETARTTAMQSQVAYDIAKQHFEANEKGGAYKASLQSAKGALDSAKAKALGAQAQLSYTQIRTPISGYVVDRPLFPGETAAAGTAVVTVMDTSTMIAKLHIAADVAQQLKTGSPATLQIPGIDEPVEAKVSLISPALDPGSTTVEVWLKAPNPNGKLKAGAPLHVTMKGRSVENAMLVPTEAITRSGEGGGKIVLVITGDGTVKKRNVEVGIQNKDSTQILSGLKPDDLVIIGGGYGLDDGAKVKVGPAEAKEGDAADKPEAKDGAAADKPDAKEGDAAAKPADAKEGEKK